MISPKASQNLGWKGKKKKETKSLNSYVSNPE